MIMFVACVFICTCFVSLFVHLLCLFPSSVLFLIIDTHKLPIRNTKMIKFNEKLTTYNKN